MMNFDDVKRENRITQSKLDKYSRPSIQNINNRRLWIRKNKYIT